MSEERPMSDLEILMNAPEGVSEEAFDAYLEEACGGDATLLQQVRALAAAREQARSFLDDGVFGATVADGGPERREGEGDQIGRYKLLQKIGEGGFGDVYMAEQSAPVKRRVALKIIKQGMDTRQVIARFEAERQALAMMEHPNIAKVFDAGATETGRPYFVMELVRGTPITTFCDEHSLEYERRLALFQDVCSAVGHAHQKGIIHRDLKPSNILVGMDGDQPIVKVIDFGVAKATQLQLTDKTLFTRFEQFIGTPLYISPEQASLSPIDIDTRSDIYSLGVLLYELLTGKPPIDQETLKQAGFDEMRRLIREQEAPKPSTRFLTATEEELTAIAKARHTEPRKLGSFLRGDLDWIVLKALEKDRKRRYDSTATLRRDIEQFLNDEVVSATPPSAAYKFQKFARRHRGAMVAVAAVILALLAGTIVSTSQWLRAEDEAENALLAQAEAAEREKETAEARDLAQRRLWSYARADRATAGELIANDRVREAMAYLARSSRNDPAATEAFATSWDVLREWNRASMVTRFERPLDVIDPADRMAMRPDGRQVAAYGKDPDGPGEGKMKKTVGRVWDASTGAVVASHVPQSEDESVGAVAFDASAACLMLVWKDYEGADDVGAARIWDCAAGRYRATLEEEGQHTWPVAFSPDGSRVLISLEGKGFGIWDTSTGKLVGPQEKEISLRSAWFSADGSRVMGHDSHSQLPGHRALVWDAGDGTLIATAEGASPALDPRSARILRGEAIVDVESGEEITSLEGGKLLESPAVNGSGMSFTAVVGYTTSGGRVRTLGVGFQDGSAFSPDGGRFAEATGKGSISLWDARTGKLVRTLAGDRGAAGVRRIQFSADGLLLISDGSKVWDSRGGTLLGRYDGGDGLLSPDGSQIVSREGIWEWRRSGIGEAPELPEVDAVPGWWAGFLELLGMRYFDENQELVRVSADDWKRRRDDLGRQLEGDDSSLAEVARWLLAPVAERGLRPGEALATHEAVDRLISVEASKEQLQEAYGLWPDHPLIHLALARDEKDPDYLEFLARYSLDRLSDDAGLRRRAEALQADLDVSRALLAAEDGDWEEAQARFAGFEMQPIAGRRERKAGFLHEAKGLLLLRAAVENPDVWSAYEAHCLAMLERVEDYPDELFGAVTTSLGAAHAPDSRVVSEALRLTREAHEAKPKDGNTTLLRGIAEFRAGDPAAAIPLLERRWSGFDRAILAMALHAEGKAEEALVETQALVEIQAQVDAAADGGARRRRWQDRLLVSLALEEAKRVTGWRPPAEDGVEEEPTGE